MSLYRATTRAGRHAIDAIANNPTETLLALDYDGTLAPIVEDPEEAHPLEEAMSGLERLGALVGSVAIVTGREVHSAVRLGRFAERENLNDLVILGQYGIERWDASTGEFFSPAVPNAIAEVEEALPAVLAEAGHPEAGVEHKKRAIAVHTRRLPDPDVALQALEEPLQALAHSLGLTVQPGKYVWEIRAADSDKGQALRKFRKEVGASIVVYAGDDVGDIEAWNALDGFRDRGIAGVGICSASEEQPDLEKLVDIVCEGPWGVAAWLHELADAIEDAS